jgi:RNA polymerase sigma-70 factor, ECF subfamily
MSSLTRRLDWDWAAVHELCLRETRRVLGTSATAEDAAQEAVIRAWRQRDRCRTPDRPAPWIATIARREALRSLSRDIPAPLDDDAGPVSVEFDGAGIAASTDIRRELAQRPIHERELLFARYWQDRSLEAIARDSGTNPVTIRVRLHRSLDRIGKNLAGT